MRNLKKYSNHSGYSVNESLGKIVSICKTENHVHYEGRPYTHKIEYLQSSGTQYIDTEIIPDANTCFKVDTTITNNGDIQMGAYFNMNYRFHMGKYSHAFSFGIGNKQITPVNHDNNRHTFEINSNGTAKLDNTSYDVGAVYAGTGLNYSIGLCARISNTPGCFIQSNLYSAQIYQGGVLVRDMYPVRVGQVGYMYDRISKRLFGNLGTGTFTLGPDI